MCDNKLYLICAFVCLALFSLGYGNKIRNFLLRDKTGNNICIADLDCFTYSNDTLLIEFLLYIDKPIKDIQFDFILTYGRELNETLSLTKRRLLACHNCFSGKVELGNKKCWFDTIPPSSKAYKVTYNVFVPYFEDGALLDIKSNKGLAAFRTLYSYNTSEN